MTAPKKTAKKAAPAAKKAPAKKAPATKKSATSEAKPASKASSAKPASAKAEAKKPAKSLGPAPKKKPAKEPAAEVSEVADVERDEAPREGAKKTPAPAKEPVKAPPVAEPEADDEEENEGDEAGEGSVESEDAPAGAPSVGAAVEGEGRAEVVPEGRAGARLDRVLCELFPGLSRARAKAMIEQGQVRVNGRRARKGDPLAAGARVSLLAEPPPRDFTPVPQPELAVPVRKSDARTAVFDKPAGMPAHPLKPDEKGTLANAVIAKFPKTEGVGFAKREPGLMHRLDTDTSGLVLVALDQGAFESLREASRAGTIRKKYVALVEGVVESDGRVEYPLVPHRKDPKRVEAVTPNVRLRAGTRTFEATTRYTPRKVLKAGEATFTLVEVELASAFRHQVRVHLATAGHPLAGDTLYRGPSLSEQGLTRHFLHASSIAYPDPATGQTVTVESPLPDELARVLKALGG